MWCFCFSPFAKFPYCFPFPLFLLTFSLFSLHLRSPSSAPCLSSQYLFFNCPLQPVITPFWLPFRPSYLIYLPPSLFFSTRRSLIQPLVFLPSFSFPSLLGTSPPFFSSILTPLLCSLLEYPPDSTQPVSPLSPPLFPTPASLWPFPRQLDAEGGVMDDH